MKFYLFIILLSLEIFSKDHTKAVWLSFPYWDLTQENKEILSTYLKNHGVNTVYLSVYGSSQSRWPSKALIKSGLVSKAHPDEYFINGVNTLRDSGIKVVAWFEGGLSVYLNTPFAKKTNLLLDCNGSPNSSEHGGKVMAFIDPSQNKALYPILEALKELAAHPLNFPEIQLDRYRYTIDDKNSICKTINGTTSPNHINNAVKKSYLAIKTVNPEILVSASPVGSYGFWKFNQRWGKWVQEGYIDSIVTQAYIVPTNLSKCKRGTPENNSRKLTTSLFKMELATLSGKPHLLKKTFKEIMNLGGDPGIFDMNKRIMLATLREKQLKPSFDIKIGYRAHVFDDSECVLDQIRLSHSLGYHNISLWISQIKPSPKGDPHPTIHDNLSLLSETQWQ